MFDLLEIDNDTFYGTGEIKIKFIGVINTDAFHS
jgi:hypothetical protein